MKNGLTLDQAFDEVLRWDGIGGRNELLCLLRKCSTLDRVFIFVFFEIVDFILILVSN